MINSVYPSYCWLPLCFLVNSSLNPSYWLSLSLSSASLAIDIGAIGKACVMLPQKGGSDPPVNRGPYIYRYIYNMYNIYINIIYEYMSLYTNIMFIYIYMCIYTYMCIYIYAHYTLKSQYQKSVMIVGWPWPISPLAAEAAQSGNCLHPQERLVYNVDWWPAEDLRWGPPN